MRKKMNKEVNNTRQDCDIFSLDLMKEIIGQSRDKLQN